MRLFTCLRGALASLLVICCLPIASTPAFAASPDEATRVPESSLEFLQTNCIDCHDGPFGEGGFDVESVSNDLASLQTFDAWVRIFDRVEKGEMPPPDDADLDEAARSQFLTPTRRALMRASRTRRAESGRVQGRRLSNEQLERTLQDLLGIDIPLSRLMPAESRNSGYVHLADAQTMSHFQLESHLNVVDTALDAAFDRALRPEPNWSVDLEPKSIANKPRGRRNREPELRNGLAVTWSSGLPYYGRVSSSRVPRGGTYQISFTASALKPPAESGTPQTGTHNSSEPSIAPGVWCSVRSGECVSRSPLMSWIGGFRVTEQPKTYSFEAWIPEGHMLEIRPADATLARAKVQGGNVGLGECEDQDVPGIALHRLQLKQIHPLAKRPTVQNRLLPNVSLRRDKQTRTLLPNLTSMGNADVREQLADQLTRFANIAFRRPTSTAQIKPYIEFTHSVFDESLASGEDRRSSFVAATRAGYRAVLCSPRFLYLCESTDDDGRLDDWSLASRLSYFLCGSMPDEKLRAAADQGKLRDADQLKRQTDRLLKTRRGRRFVEEFTAQWLDLIDIDFTEPDRRLFRDFDTIVQNAMLGETHHLIQHLLDNDLPVRDLVNCDYSFLNERLARYYGVAQRVDVDGNQLGDELRMVRFGPDSHRGGLLSHGSIHKVTANGNDTSPVLRGIWVCERILGQEIPPPPNNVPAVEPDIRGATTIRELLAKHESDPSCASCHKNFDPPGFALENFDAGGKWRDHYRQLRGRKYVRGAKVDPSYTMVDGTDFDSFERFCELIAKDDDTLAANLATQMLTFATGAKLQFADRPVVESIVSQTSANDHGVRTILHAVVCSDTFLNK
ncbi:MAG: DUF1592 domain-containing protein [Rhodopirellula sp. JB044]|uniref:DUF1592 domain-containing protein n=1 Tax=Rhodopirellula sp. JB044 TaxID=3342844 RepID=UPI003709E03E